MTKVLADIDIDVQSFDPRILNCVQASRVHNGNLAKHPVGVYFQNIPKDPITKLSAIPFDKAEDYDYFKIDLLHVSVYDTLTKEEIRYILKQPVDYDLMLDREVASQLFQLKNHYDIIARIKPKSIIEIADCIAMIRPGKRYLLEKYIRDRNNIRKILYTKVNESDFRKSHAIAYAHIVVLQLYQIKNSEVSLLTHGV